MSCKRYNTYSMYLIVSLRVTVDTQASSRGEANRLYVKVSWAQTDSGGGGANQLVVEEEELKTVSEGEGITIC